MKIGLDIHGVIDRFPLEFAWLSRKWVKTHGHEVHIVTGESWETAKAQVEDRNICYTQVYSIVDHHRLIGTPMKLDADGWWMNAETWNRSKGDYARLVGLDIHFEDSLRYAPWFLNSCTFIHVGEDFEKSILAIGDFHTAFSFLSGTI